MARQSSGAHAKIGGLGFADGLRLGVGIAIGHRVVDVVLGPRVFRHEASGAQATPNDVCVGQYKAFEECLKTSGYWYNISRCQLYMDMLTECRKAAAAPPTTHTPAATPSATAVN